MLRETKQEKFLFDMAVIAGKILLVGLIISLIWQAFWFGMGKDIETREYIRDLRCERNYMEGYCA